MNIAEMQERLEHVLTNNKTVEVEAEKIAIARTMTDLALEVSDQSFEPRAIVARNVWFMAVHGSSVLDKKMLMLLADTAALDNNHFFERPITPEDLLRTKLALCFAFNHAFPQRDATLRKDQTAALLLTSTPT